MWDVAEVVASDVTYIGNTAASGADITSTPKKLAMVDDPTPTSRRLAGT
jgi:hypothetical protein